jgi:hypothetical protein
MPTEASMNNKVNTFQMLVEEDELVIDVKQFMYQQERNCVNMFRHLQMHKHCLSKLEENYEDVSHVAKQLDKNIKMIQILCKQVVDYQSSEEKFFIGREPLT